MQIDMRTVVRYVTAVLFSLGLTFLGWFFPLGIPDTQWGGYVIAMAAAVVAVGPISSDPKKSRRALLPAVALIAVGHQLYQQDIPYEGVAFVGFGVLGAFLGVNIISRR